MRVSGAEASPSTGWTFLTNHMHVLLCLAIDPSMRQRDIAMEVGITERAAQGIVNDLEAAGFIEKTRVGRRNNYRINGNATLRHRLEAHHTVGELLDLLRPGASSA